MRSWGFTVLEAGGWQTRDAEPKTPYDPTRMFLEHHDASTILSGTWGALAYVTNQKLAQLVYSRDGQAILVAAGVTWHAGVGGPFLDVPANQGNRYSMAVEVANSGAEPYSPALTRLIVAGEAAWCVVTRRTPDRVRGHKEWATPTGRKQDPSVSMTQRRADVAAYLKQGDDVLTDDQDLRLRNIERALGAIGAAPNGPNPGMPVSDTILYRVRALPALLAGADVDEQALAHSLAPLLAGPLVSSIVSELEGVDGLTTAEAEAAAERAVRRVLGGLDTPTA
jgi:hypothetical protein